MVIRMNVEQRKKKKNKVRQRRKTKKTKIKKPRKTAWSKKSQKNDMNDNEKIKKRYPKHHYLASSCCFVHCKYDLDGELI